LVAGTAASAVSALNITQTIGINAGNATLATASPFGIQWTWNDVNCATGVKWVVTDTSSAAASLPFQILGGAAGTTNLFSISKVGTARFGDGTSSNPTIGFFSQTNLGLYKWGTDAVAISNNGNVNWFASAGNMGLGQTSAIIWSNAANNAISGTWTASIGQISAGLLGIGASGTSVGFGGRLKLTSTIVAATTVAALNASPTVGEISTVNDALAVTAKGATVTAGGSAVAVLVWNGANWVGI